MYVYLDTLGSCQSQYEITYVYLFVPDKVVNIWYPPSTIVDIPCDYSHHDVAISAVIIIPSAKDTYYMIIEIVGEIQT